MWTLDYISVTTTWQLLQIWKKRGGKKEKEREKEKECDLTLNLSYMASKMKITD